MFNPNVVTEVCAASEIRKKFEIISGTIERKNKNCLSSTTTKKKKSPPPPPPPPPRTSGKKTQPGECETRFSSDADYWKQKLRQKMSSTKRTTNPIDGSKPKPVNSKPEVKADNDAREEPKEAAITLTCNRRKSLMPSLTEDDISSVFIVKTTSRNNVSDNNIDQMFRDVLLNGRPSETIEEVIPVSETLILQRTDELEIDGSAYQLEKASDGKVPLESLPLLREIEIEACLMLPAERSKSIDEEEEINFSETPADLLTNETTHRSSSSCCSSFLESPIGSIGVATAPEVAKDAYEIVESTESLTERTREKQGTRELLYEVEVPIGSMENPKCQDEKTRNCRLTSGSRESEAAKLPSNDGGKMSSEIYFLKSLREEPEYDVVDSGTFGVMERAQGSISPGNVSFFHQIDQDRYSIPAKKRNPKTFAPFSTSSHSSSSSSSSSPSSSLYSFSLSEGKEPIDSCRSFFDREKIGSSSTVRLVDDSFRFLSSYDVRE